MTQAPLFRASASEKSGGPEIASRAPPLGYIKKYWWVPILVAIFILALWLRIQPLRFNEMPDIDTYYWYRLDSYMLNHNLQLPSVDTLRNFPFGDTQPFNEPLMTVQFPVYLYLLFSWGIDWFHFTLLIPAVLGALSVIVMFFLTKEFGGTKAGLFGSFFLSVIIAYFARTSGGEFEKEAFACVFILLNIWLFIKAYKSPKWKSSLVYSVLSGICLFITAQAWGGFAFNVLLLSLFSFIMVLLNRNFSQIAKSFAPMIIIPLVLSQFFAYNLLYPTSYLFLISLGVLALVAIRYAAERYSLMKKEQLPWLAPGLTVLFIVVVLMGAMFSDQVYNILNSGLQAVGLVPSVELSTVAESQAGSFYAIATMTSPLYAEGVLPYMSLIINYFSLWIFAVFGIVVIAYKFYKKPEWLAFIPLLWILASIWGTLGYIRFGFALGPPFALLSALFIGWLIERAGKLKVMAEAKNIKQKINYVSIPLVIFLVLLIVINTASAYVYSLGLGPSDCITQPQFLIDSQKCLETDSHGNIVKYAPSQPWYQAFDFLKYNTRKDQSLITWWDFGYWYQARGDMPTVSDGGWGNRYEIALWYTADAKNWSDLEPFLNKFKVGYIIQEYTLPGKYGAISKIASQGQQVFGIQQFERTNAYQKENKTIFEFTAGPYAIWLPVGNNSQVVDTPMFLVSQNGQYMQSAYINDICSSAGLVNAGNKTPSLGGCLAITDIGVYYVPEEVKNTIFSRLQFMDGKGLPVEKVFDNSLIKIYKILYSSNASS